MCCLKEGLLSVKVCELDNVPGGGGLLSLWPQSSVDTIELHALYGDGWNPFLEQGGGSGGQIHNGFWEAPVRGDSPGGTYPHNPPILKGLHLVPYECPANPVHGGLLQPQKHPFCHLRHLCGCPAPGTLL